MKTVGRIGLVTALLMLSPPQSAMAEQAIDDFFGRWKGEGITEDGAPASGFGDLDRKLEVVVEPSDDGFTITWETVRTTRKKSGEAVRRGTVSAPFVRTDKAGLYRVAVEHDPVSGFPFMWAQLKDRTLVVNSITVSEAGKLEHQKYTRILVEEDEMQLLYTRAIDGSVVRSVFAVLGRQ